MEKKRETWGTWGTWETWGTWKSWKTWEAQMARMEMSRETSPPDGQNRKEFHHTYNPIVPDS